MKKVLFSFICLLTCFSIVSAKTQIEYDWGKFEEFDHILNSNLLDNNLGVVYRNSTGENQNLYNYVLYDNNGEEIKIENALDDNNYLIINNQLISTYYDSDKDSFYQRVYDKNLNLIKELEVSRDFHNNYFDTDRPIIGMNEKYYYIYDYLFDRDTNEEINIDEVIEKHELYDEYYNYVEAGNFAKSDEVLFEIYRDEFNKTSLIVDFLLYLNNFNYSADICNFVFDDNGNLAIIFQDRSSDEYWIEVYDSELEFAYSIDVNSYYQPYVFFRDSKFYFVEAKYPRERITSDESTSYKVVMYEFDLEGDILDEFHLTNMIDKEYYYDSYDDYEKYYDYRVIAGLVAADDGFYLLTTKPVLYPESTNPSLSDPDAIEGVYPTIQKFSFIYDIETVQNDNGDIIIDRESSKNGDVITYTVKPKEGYKLDKVIVTDENGNKIEIRDNSFTMPNSNVTVEAVFVVDNPNTGAFLKIGFVCIILFVSFYFIVLRNIRIKQFE